MKLTPLLAALPLALVPKFASADCRQTLGGTQGDFLQAEAPGWLESIRTWTAPLGALIPAGRVSNPQLVLGGFEANFTRGTAWTDMCNIGRTETEEEQGSISGVIPSGPLLDKYGALGFTTSYLAFPIGPSQATATEDGTVAFFEGDNTDGGVDAAIYASTATGAWAMHGIIFQQYEAYGQTASALGYPLSDERACTLPNCATGGRENRTVNGYMEYAPFGGAPLVPNPAWAMMTVSEQASRLAVFGFGNGHITGLDIKSTTWPGTEVQISLNTVNGRIVIGTIPVTNGVFELVDSNLSLTSAIAGTGNAAGHLVVTIEAKALAGEFPGFTQISSVIVE